MKKIFWTLANAQGAESSKPIKPIFDLEDRYFVEGITKNDLIAVYFYIREKSRELSEISSFLVDKTKAYLCIMTLFEEGYIQPEIKIEEDNIIPTDFTTKVKFNPPFFNKK